MDITKRNKIKRISIIIVSIIIAVFFIIKVMPEIFFAGLSAYVDYQKAQNQKLLDKNGVKTLPCESASSVELGSPLLMSRKTAEFTTSGGMIYIKPRQFDAGGGWTVPSISTSIIIGRASTPPDYNEQTGVITNIYKKLEFNKTDYGILDLLAGRYWLWSSSGDVVIYSCEEGGVSDPKPVR